MVDSTPGELSPKRLLVSWLPAVLWAGLIFYLSAQSEVAAPGPVGRLPGWTYLGHWCEYFVLGALLYRGVQLSWGRSVRQGQDAPATGGAPGRGGELSRSGIYLAAIVIGALYAASDEWHQAYVPGRFADIFDWLTDLAGALLGALAVAVWHLHRDHKQP